MEASQPADAFAPLKEFFSKPENLRMFTIAAFVIAAIVRLIFVLNQGFEADISFWKSWGLAWYDHDIVWSIKNTNNNYPTPFAYVLGAMVWVYSLFADPHNFNQFWSNTNMLFLFISKLPSILADYGIALLIIYIGKRAGRLGFPQLPLAAYQIAASAYLLSPISVIDGAWWGQVDSVGLVLFLCGIVAMLSGMPFLGGMIYMASMMTKLQNMIYGPVVFLFLWQLWGYRGLMRGLAGALLAFLILNIEFFLAREMSLVFESLTVNYDYFPFMSLNAYNLWWIVARAQGMKMLDKFTMIGMTNAKTIGLYLFISMYFFAALNLFFESAKRMARAAITVSNPMDRESLVYRLMSALVIVNAAFFLFQTESHDRYAFPLSVFLLLWGVFYIHARLTKHDRPNFFMTRPFKLFGVFYLLYTVVYFYNLHTALVANYPNNGIPILRSLTDPILTIGASYLQLGLFAVFLFALSKLLPKLIFAAPVLVFLGLMVHHNLPLILKKPVHISAIHPIISQQEFGKRQTDMAVNSFNGINAWNPLSVQYAFYRKGIGTHAKSYHQYHINGKFRTFTTDYGIDTEAGGAGSATFEIYGDDKPLFISEKIVRYEYPRHIEVDITGVKMLGLVTNDAKDGINDDHTDWLNAKLLP